ncbi:hypothetical protein [Neptuniibacter caesariensis]|uniref:Uncharacterized protein n=1 Tax=Neptuniibacter caesariensis TaxID=207954 RepID=A0A7U8GTE1_NEPCE|nr:hypothetical protein [Neptuniibacter caesariensis]EAR62050.1 hypothetical protein MED92_10104 [Oceanospirillum sp. MED92] [Neptuniibacter caesariensis]
MKADNLAAATTTIRPLLTSGTWKQRIAFYETKLGFKDEYLYEAPQLKPTTMSANIELMKKPAHKA